MCLSWTRRGSSFRRTRCCSSITAARLTRCKPRGRMSGSRGIFIRMISREFGRSDKTASQKELRLRLRERLLGKDGRYRWFLVRYKPMVNEEGASARWYATATDIEDRKRTESLLAAEMRTLQMIADSASLKDILNHVCTSIDLQILPSVTTILLMASTGQELWPTAGPRVPHGWTRTITPVRVAPDGGLCATAAFLKTRVIVPDVVQ